MHKWTVKEMVFRSC